MTIVPGISLMPGWLNASKASMLLQELREDLSWRQDPVTIFGQSRLQPRLTAWCADKGIRYAYSGLQLRPQSWHPGLLQLREALHEKLGYEFNSVLANAYRDGNDSMGWHADDEPELGHKPLIASVSLGATRRFLMRRKFAGTRSRRSTGIDLAHGDLLIMSDDSQSQWQHSLSRTRKPVGLRVNLTYRNVLN